MKLHYDPPIPGEWYTPAGILDITNGGERIYDPAMGTGWIFSPGELLPDALALNPPYGVSE